MTEPIHFTNSEPLSALLLQHPNVILDFWAPWCAPCNQLSAVLKQLAANNPSVTVLKVNADDFPEIAAKHNVRGLPTLVFYKNAAPQATKVGSIPLPLLQQLSTAYLGV